ncbi:MAG: hydrogenase maturation protease [Coriobacteriia bacterium]
MTSAPERITVMGVGNPLCRDEGIGPRVTEELLSRFEFPDHVRVIDAGTMGMGILNLFRECDFLLVVDAVDGTGEPPGTVVRVAAEDVAGNQVMHSLHDVRLIDVLQAAELIGARPQATFVGVQARDIGGPEIGLSPEVAAAVPAAVDAVLAVLAERGIVPVECAGDADGAAVLRAVRRGDD